MVRRRPTKAYSTDDQGLGTAATATQPAPYVPF
jgi:hypothetical protein